MFLLIPWMGWAILIFSAVLPPLSHSCTMSTLVLHIIYTKKTNFQSALKSMDYTSISRAFQLPLSCLAQTPTNLPEFWPVCHEILTNLGSCSYLCVYNIGLASLHPFLPAPVSNQLAFPMTRFAGQIHLVLSLLLLIVVKRTPLHHLKLCSNMVFCWKHQIRCLLSLIMACRLYLIPFIVFP